MRQRTFPTLLTLAALALAACAGPAGPTDPAENHAEEPVADQASESDPADEAPEPGSSDPADEAPEPGSSEPDSSEYVAQWAAAIVDHLRHNAPQVVTDFNVRRGGYPLRIDWNDNPQHQLWILLTGPSIGGTPTLEVLRNANPGTAYHESMVVLLGGDRPLANDVIDWGIAAHDESARQDVQRRWEQATAEPSPLAEFDRWLDVHAETSDAIDDAFAPMSRLPYQALSDWELSVDEIDDAVAAGPDLAATARDLLLRWEQMSFPEDYQDAYGTVLDALDMYIEIGETVEVCRNHPSDACDRWAQQTRDASWMLSDTYSG